MFQKQTRTKCGALSFTAVFGQLPVYVAKIDSLAKTVDKKDFRLLTAGFPNIGDDLFQRLIKEGFFPVQLSRFL